MAEHEDEQRRIGRRSLLRGGAVLAGAAGATAAGAVAGVPAARAADGDPLLIGEGNLASSTTELVIGGAQGVPDRATLALLNLSGPALLMEPLEASEIPDLAPGAILMTQLGPYFGRGGAGDVENDFLVTGLDLSNAVSTIPVTVTFDPVRAVDTRTAAGRARVVRSSAPLRSDGKLTAGSWVEVLLAQVGDGVIIDGVYVTLTAGAPEGNGYLTGYPGPGRPPTATVSYRAGDTTSSSALIGSTVADTPAGQAYVMRVFTSQATWLVVDATAASLLPEPIPPTPVGRAGRRDRLADRPGALSPVEAQRARRAAAQRAVGGA